MFLGLVISPLFMFAQDFEGKSVELTYVECTARDQMGDEVIIQSAYSDAFTVEEWFDGNGNSFFKYAFFHTSTHPDDFEDSSKEILLKHNITSYFITNSGDGVSFCSSKYRLINIAVKGDATYAFTLVNLDSNEKFIVELTLIDCRDLSNPLDNGSKL